ncbi:hypothetical protein WMF11_19495 [Sorangium sp. So ce295]|jgi:hypothetical protein|uniref:hypothetical protein n=1 Tax=Sorangium sp. So ce295 TaxID=3133295 RepID=UPI003F5FFB56
MKKIQTVLLSTTFFGLVATALPGCPEADAHAAQPAEAPVNDAQAICDKAADCGKLKEGITTAQCEATIDTFYDEAQQDALCGPLVQAMQTAFACVSQHATCEELFGETSEEGVSSWEDRCFEEITRFEETLEAAAEQDPEGADACVFGYVFTLTEVLDIFGES